jgi:hypothetical protein
MWTPSPAHPHGKGKSVILNRVHSLLLFLAFATAAAQPASPAPTLVSVARIWDAGAHNAFTDLIRCEGKRYLGRQPRVMFSSDGSAWSPPKRILAEGDWLWRVAHPEQTVVPHHPGVAGVYASHEGKTAIYLARVKVGTSLKSAASSGRDQ